MIIHRALEGKSQAVLLLNSLSAVGAVQSSNIIDYMAALCNISSTANILGIFVTREILKKMALLPLR
jgi:hypothetical protein